MINKTMKRTLSAVLTCALLISGANAEISSAAKKATLNVKKISLQEGKTKAIAIKNKIKKATYSFKSSKTKVATVSKKGVVKAVKAGTATITVKEKNKKKTRKLGTVKVVVSKKTVNSGAKSTPVVSEVPATSALPSESPAASAVASESPASASPTATSSSTAVPASEAPVGSAEPIVTPEATPEVSVEPTPFDPDAYPNTAETNQRMIDASYVDQGANINNARVKAVIEKAKSGQEVTLAYIGGSITEGEAARPFNKCYAEVSCNMFAEKYGTGNNVHFINAGMSGTPSALGIMRYDRDIIDINNGKAPDLLFIEFAVNDTGECTKGGAYEGLIRRALKAGSAVILVFSVFKDNSTLQDTYIPYGNAYGLPMVSMRDAIKENRDQYDGFLDWYFGDRYHPTTDGHRVMAECIMNAITKIDAEEMDEKNIPDVDAFAPYNTAAFENTKMISPNTVASLMEGDNAIIKSFEAGGFDSMDPDNCTYIYDSSIWKFPLNWMKKTDSSTDSMKMTVYAKNLSIALKASKNKTFGAIDVFVDGVKVPSLYGNDYTFNGWHGDGWDQPIMEMIFAEDEPALHEVEIKMAAGSEEKAFTIYGFGIN